MVTTYSIMTLVNIKPTFHMQVGEHAEQASAGPAARRRHDAAPLLPVQLLRH